MKTKPSKNNLAEPKSDSLYGEQEAVTLYFRWSSINLLIRPHRSASGRMKIPYLVPSLSFNVDKNLLTPPVRIQPPIFLPSCSQLLRHPCLHLSCAQSKNPSHHPPAGRRHPHQMAIQFSGLEVVGANVRLCRGRDRWKMKDVAWWRTAGKNERTDGSCCCFTHATYLFK